MRLAMNRFRTFLRNWLTRDSVCWNDVDEGATDLNMSRNDYLAEKLFVQEFERAGKAIMYIDRLARIVPLNNQKSGSSDGPDKRIVKTCELIASNLRNE